MSYAIDIHFTPAKNEEEALIKANKLMLSLRDDIDAFKKIILSNQPWFPSVRYDYRDYDDKTLNMLDRLYLSEIFQFRFIYFKKAHLLGLIGSYTEILDRMVGFSDFITFQNSTDHDYPLEMWRSVPIYVDIFNKCQSLSADDLNLDDEERENLPYYQKSAAYDRIEKLLDISGFLYGEKENEHHTCFTMSPIIDPWFIDLRLMPMKRLWRE